MKENLPIGSTAVADLAGQPYALRTALLTDLRPNIVAHSPGNIDLFELTVCWEANFVNAKLRKESKYLHLLEEAHSNGTAATLSTIHIGCRGLVDTRNLESFFAITSTSLQDQKALNSAA